MNTFDDVLETCSESEGRCKSRLQDNDTFDVETWDPGTVRDRVYVRHTDYENREQAFRTFLEEIRFAQLVAEQCYEDGQDNDSCNISIKVNIAPTSQRYEEYPYGTDPQLTNVLTSYLREHHFQRIRLVETETNAADAHPELTPDRIGRASGFEVPVTNLSQEEMVEIDAFGGRSWVSRSLAESNVIIDMAKGKTHDRTKITAAKKNFYGAIPVRAKWRQFHRGESGLNVPEAAIASWLSTTPDFTFVDMIRTVHGNELSYLPEDERDRDETACELTIDANTFVYGENGLRVDEVVAQLMGITDGPIEELAREDLNVQPVTDNVDGEIEQIPGFKPCSRRLLAQAALQDLFPVSEELIASQIRKRYSFPILEDIRDEEE